MAIGREDVPQRLYKYCAPDRVDSLESAMLRYTPLCAFNDPFEGRPDISELAPPKELSDPLMAATIALARSSYEQLDDFQKTKMSIKAYTEVFSEMFAARREEMVSIYSETSIEMKRKILSSMDSLVGALCLTEEPTNILMWPHYAQNHEGFVIEFDAHHRYFHGQRSTEDEFHRLRRVNYRRERPNLDLKDMNGIILFLIKSNDWAYENEWRVLKPLADASHRIDVSPYPVDLFRFPRDAVKTVILGERATTATAERIRAALASHQEYAGVRLMKAVADPKLFRLILEEFPA
jgi:hypothetical protein